MLKSLYISSFVIIDKLHIDFESGMSVLTGETGAGKSIIIDALGQLCGNRASLSLIKKNCSKAVIEGVFDITMNASLQKVYDELHIELDDQLIITKEILDSGKSNVKINYQNASNNALKILMPYLIDIHSQFETQKLFEEKNHIILLDQFAAKDLKNKQSKYDEAYQQYKTFSKQLKNAIEEDMSDEQLDFLESQVNEIDEFAYTDSDIDELENELIMLQNFEKINENIQSFDQIMNSSRGALPQVNNAIHAITPLQDIEEFHDSYDNLYNYYYNLLDVYENIMETYRSFQFDEYRFNEVQETLYKVNRLKRKYGYTMERIQEYREELSRKIETIHHRDEYIQELELQKTKTYQQAFEIAQDIHAVRITNAKRFEEMIAHEFQDLYLEKAVFKILFEDVKLSQDGIDKIKFMISINQGQDLSLLNESASGGEISRIMLAIKTIILKYSAIETIIFDEVDTGVSGKVASGIGDKMHNLAIEKQVICITHLPQVACLADHHFCIEKSINNDVTSSTIYLLDITQRIEEIAKMLSGEELTSEAIENAKKLLNV